MKISVVFCFLASLVFAILAIPLSTTPLRPKTHAYVPGLSKTAQIIRFVNSVYSDGGRSFNRRGGYNDFFPYKGQNQPLITTIGLHDANRWLGKMMNIFHANGNNGGDEIKKLNNIRYYLIDNPEVLEIYRQKIMNDKRRQSQESFVFSGDYTSSSSLERERKHAIRRYVENFGLGNPETEVESNDDINTDDILKNMMPKEMNDNAEVTFQPSFPDEDLPFPEDPEFEAREPEKSEEKPKLNEAEALKLLTSAESEKITPIMTKEEHRNLKKNYHHKDFRSESYNKDIGTLNSENNGAYKNEGYKKPNKWEDNSTQSDKNEDGWTKKGHWVEENQYRPKFPEEKRAEKFTENMNWKKGVDWKQDDELPATKDRKEDWNKKKKSWNDGDDGKRDDIKKHDTYPNTNFNKDKDSDAKYWQKGLTTKKNKRIEVEYSKPDTEIENEWDLRENKRNKNRNRNPHKNKDDKIEDLHKKSDEYDKRRPDWDKKIDNDDYDKKKDNTENDRYRKEDNWNKKESWNKNDNQHDSRQNDRNKKDSDYDKKDQRDQKDNWNKHKNKQEREDDRDKRHTNKKSNEWDKVDTSDKKENDWNKKDDKKKKNNLDERDERNKHYDDWNKGDSRNKKNSDWDKKDNDWDKKDDRDRNDGGNKKGNERYQRKDYDKKEESESNHDWHKKENQRDRKDDELDKKNDDWNKKYNDWNKKNDDMEKSDGKRKKEHWDKKNDDWNKKDNQWDKRDKDNQWDTKDNQWEKKDTLRNKKDDWASKDVDWDRKDDRWNNKNKKSTADGSNWDKVGVESKKEEWGKYDEKNTYYSGDEKKKKNNDDYNSYEKKPKKTNDWDNYVPKIADYYKPKKIKRQDSYERPHNGHNPPPAFVAFGRTPIPFAGKKRIYADK